MHVVTGGSEFMDIDAYGGCVAYAELLQKQGVEARAVTSAILNESITHTIHTWHAPLFHEYTPNSEDIFTIIDVSNPEYFDAVVNHEKIAGVIDHHTGYEALWEEKLGNAANIEFVGAACTLVFEAWQKAGKLKEISQVSARVLIAGILDNTLNFEANITTDRDRTAYTELMKHADLPEDWPAQYFGECQKSIEMHLDKALRNDTKTFAPELGLPQTFGQLVVWNGWHLATQRSKEIAATLSSIGPDWAINIVSIQEGASYFMASSQQGQYRLAKTLGVTFQFGLAKAERLWLRKEIIKAAEASRRH